MSTPIYHLLTSGSSGVLAYSLTSTTLSRLVLKKWRSVLSPAQRKRFVTAISLLSILAGLFFSLAAHVFFDYCIQIITGEWMIMPVCRW